MNIFDLMSGANFETEREPKLLLVSHVDLLPELMGCSIDEAATQLSTNPLIRDLGESYCEIYDSPIK